MLVLLAHALSDQLENGREQRYLRIHLSPHSPTNTTMPTIVTRAGVHTPAILRMALPGSGTLPDSQSYITVIGTVSGVAVKRSPVFLHLFD